MSIEKEKYLCDQNKITFQYYNIEGQIMKIAKIIEEDLKNGSCIVHCRNGAHRAPAMIAYFLRTKISKDSIINVLGWNELVKKPKKYIKYTRILEK